MALTGGGTTVLVPNEAAAEEPMQEAQKLYQEGRKLYRVGKYEQAVGKFERAYELSEQPLLLYNIALAYKRWYSVSKDVGHLRKAKQVFENYRIELDRNPSVGDIEEADAQIRELDAAIKQAEADEAEARRLAAERTPEDKPEDKPGPPVGPKGQDPGKKLRIGGIASMGAGGVLLVTGGVLGIVFSLKGQQFEEELTNIRNEQMNNNCTGSEVDGECGRLNDDETTTKDNGRQANLLSGISLGLLGGLGVVALATGGGLFAWGLKRTKAWEKGRTVELRLQPTWGGVVLSGRF